MSLVLIGVGTVANDHTGDPFRTAFQKTNAIIDALNSGPVTIGPPLSSSINLTIDQGSYENNQHPGIWVKGNAGFQAAIAIGANGTTPGVGSFDFQQAATGDGYIVVRPAAGLAIWTNNTPRLTISSDGFIAQTAPTADTLGFFISGSSNVASTKGALKVTSPVNIRISTFNCDAGNGGWIALARGSTDKAYFGDSSPLVGGQVDDYCLRSNAGLALTSPTSRIALSTNSTPGINFQTGPVSLTSRTVINTAGNWTHLVPDSGISISVATGALFSTAVPGIVISGDGGAGAGFSLCANGTTPGAQSFDFYQGNAGDATIAQRANSTLTFLTNNSTALSLAADHKATFTAAIGVNSVSPPAQVTGWGTPTGAAVVNNFSGAAATLVNCSNAIAKIITDLKNLGFYGA